MDEPTTAPENRRVGAAGEAVARSVLAAWGPKPYALVEGGEGAEF